MNFQYEFFRHITDDDAGDAAPLLAKLALCAGYDSKAYPFPFEELRLVGDFRRKLGTQGLNEFYAIECARAMILEEIRPWEPHQVEALVEIAKRPTSLPFSAQFPKS